MTAQTQKKPYGFALTLLFLVVSGCSDKNDERPNNVTYENEQQQDMSQQGTKEFSKSHSNNVSDITVNTVAPTHRTITFDQNSTELTNTAEETLHSMVQSLKEKVPTQLTVRSVNPNDVTSSDADELNKKRADTVKSFLQNEGISVAAVRVNKFSSREYESSQDSEMVQDQAKATPGMSELEPVGDANEEQQKQQVVITVVSAN